MKIRDTITGHTVYAVPSPGKLVVDLLSGPIQSSHTTIDLRPNLVLLEGSPEEILLWSLAGGKLAEGLKNPLQISISRIPELIDRLQRIYRETDPEDYSCKISLLDILSG